MFGFMAKMAASLAACTKYTVVCLFETAKETTRLVLFGLETVTYELAVSTARVARKWEALWKEHAVDPCSGSDEATFIALVSGNGSNSKYGPDRVGRYSSLESFFDVYGDNIGTLDSGDNTGTDDTDEDSNDEGYDME